MTTIHLVAHTHWDREWYLPFQSFRLKLVHLIDFLLAEFGRNPLYTHYMLDGQTIVLEDYLQMRPERREEIARWVVQGRLDIGPWYVLPDTFLVSPEATIRNLLEGRLTCTEFGRRMEIGYLPDPFGHFGQIPQILNGFGITRAALRRGLDDQPCELWWEAPDGSQVLLAYLREGYGNAARLPTTPSGFKAGIEERIRALDPYCATSHRLLLNGTDHQEPQPEVPQLIRDAWHSKKDAMRLSTLSNYIDGMEAEIASRRLSLPTVRGELRSPKRHHLLPGVLSSRAWIKQRNHACETLLQQWAEPFSAWAELLAGKDEGRTIFTGRLTTPRLEHPQAVLRQAWRLLMQCHPHDSICGCSIDQVHEEMRSRFDQVEQIADEVTSQSLSALAHSVDTAAQAPPGSIAAVVVFNPGSASRTDVVQARVPLSAGLDVFRIVDETGAEVPFRLKQRTDRPLADMNLDAEGLKGMLSMVEGGHALGLAVQAVAIVEQPDGALVDVLLSESGGPDQAALAAGQAAAARLLEDPARSKFRLLARLTSEADIEVLATGVPGHGLRTYWLAPAAGIPPAAAEMGGTEIENEFLSVAAGPDGTLELTDRRTGRRFPGLLRLSDIGERGDSYTHCPLAGDTPIHAPSGVPQISRRVDRCGQTLIVRSSLRLPESLSADRRSRRADSVECPVEAQLTLTPGVPRLDVQLRFTNRASDHRLQALFPTGSATTLGYYDDGFEVVARPTVLPEADATWVERPVPEAPMRGFVAAGDEAGGLMIATRGLYEASVSPDGVIAITLLRCFGWLSREDLESRQGDAGPSLETPGGQELGSHTFRLSLIPYVGPLSQTSRLSDTAQVDLRASAAPLQGGTLPHSVALLQIDRPAFRVTAVKAPQAGEGLIVRGVNLDDHAIRVALRSNLDVRVASQVRMDESEIGPLTVDEGHVVAFEARAHQIVTLRLALTAPG